MPQQTLAQFGQSIKAKHPEYADIPDEALGQKVLAKYPQYADMVAAAPSLTDNPFGEGVYRMVSPDSKGSYVSVPFSRVQEAGSQGFKFQDEATRTRWSKDHQFAQKDAENGDSGTTLNKIAQGAKDLATGIGKGALSTISVGDDWARENLPAFMTNGSFGFGAPADLQREAAMKAPANTMQAIGKGAEQAAEFFIPGAGLEEGAAQAVGKIAPKLKTAARIAGAAANAGLVNRVQGGTFAGGAAAGAAGAGAAAALRAIAPSIAETALRIRATDRAYGATPGAAALEHTTGISPAAVAETARQAMQDTQAEIGNLVHNATGNVDLAKTRNIATEAINRAAEENHPETFKKLKKLGDQVFEDYQSGQRIPQQVSPDYAAALNRGIANAKTSWNPATANSSMSAAAGMMHHELGDAIADVVPDIRPLNQRVQSLIPVIQRGTAVDLNAGPAQRLFSRIGAHTGALAGAGIGYATHGLPGAVAGFVLPELVSSPEAQMGMARAANSATTPVVTKAAGAVGVQATRGPSAWANRGAEKLAALGIDDATIESLKGSRAGLQTLMYASDLSPDSKAMKAILARLGNGQTGDQ